MLFAVKWRHVKVAKLGVERTLETPNLESLTVRFQPKDTKRGNVKMVRSTMLNEGCRYPMLILDCMGCQFTSSSQDKF